MGILVISFLAVMILSFLATYFLIKKFTKGNKPLKNPLYWIVSALLTPVIYIGVIWIYFTISSYYPMRNFDKTEWINNRNIRYEYVDDLIDKEKLIGYTKSEVKEMLGKADGESDSTLTYYIGYSPKYFMNMDPDWLELEFNNEKVSHSRVRQ